MLKSSTGTERSDHTTTCASTAVAEALLTENTVSIPHMLSRSTSKYGSRRVAAGTASIVQITARPGAAARKPASSRRARQLFFMKLLLESVQWMKPRDSRESICGEVAGA